MLLKIILPRVFCFKLNGQDMELPDPNPATTAQGVLQFYANTYPILTTAMVKGPEICNDKIVYSFTSTVGTKG